ncbi:MAG: hypothetical protein P8X74_04635 [Reinekea sp.]|jgi:hypothetical protein
MLKIDEFESVFRSAVKDNYRHQDIGIRSAVLLTDLSESEAQALLAQVKVYCAAVHDLANVSWHMLSGTEFQQAEVLLNSIEQFDVDLIVTYRNLYSNAWQHPFSLGEHLDILVQKTPTPVLVIPHPHANYKRDPSLNSCTSAMVVTDHLVNNHRLVSSGLTFLPQKGELYLTHIEDQFYFDRIIDAFSKIPNIDTELATQTLSEQLLKAPAEYIKSVITELDALEKQIHVNAIVEFGHQLKDYIKHIEQKRVDLLVIDAKDGEQMAMHGLAYPLAIEVRNIPVLML